MRRGSLYDMISMAGCASDCELMSEILRHDCFSYGYFLSSQPLHNILTGVLCA